MFGLDTGLAVLLIVCLVLACFFEFINGFHDSANAVATVIYTNAMRPTAAVVFSGILNFLGVTIGIAMVGPVVAMGIVNLLPMEVLVDANPYHGVALVMALLVSAIIWNFGTWYFGLPASSSHTLIGSILGIGLAYYFLPGTVGGSAVNWDKAKDTGMALLFSPLLGFSAAIIMMFVFKRLIKNETIYKEPIPGKTPPIWIRMILWATCGLVSFFHGMNDGQKGIGIILMILISILPGYFALDETVNLQSVHANIDRVEFLMKRADTNSLAAKEKVLLAEVIRHGDHFHKTTEGKFSSDEVPVSERFALRQDIVKMTKNSETLIKGGNLTISANEIKGLQAEVKETKKLVEYAPSWVTILISISLGFGTMIGWKRIVRTIGEKIGKQNMSYAQGASAQLVASMGIGLASAYGLPVSTTHMLSSGVAGSMVAKKGLKNLQKKTVSSIVLAWVLTLPATMILSGGLFLLFRALI